MSQGQQGVKSGTPPPAQLLALNPASRRNLGGRTPGYGSSGSGSRLLVGLTSEIERRRADLSSDTADLLSLLLLAQQADGDRLQRRSLGGPERSPA